MTSIGELGCRSGGGRRLEPTGGESPKPGATEAEERAEWNRSWALLFLPVPVLGVAVFAVAPSINVWLPRDVSAHGQEIDSLFYFILALTGVVFIATEVLLF